MLGSPLLGTYLAFVAQGLVVTFALSLFALTIGSALGFVGGAGRASSHRRLGRAIGLYVSIFRSVPVVIQLFVVFYGAPVVLGLDLNPFAAAVAALAIYLGAYLTEIVRAGLESLPRGQSDAAHALGLDYPRMMRYVVLPQAMRVIVPPWIGLIVGGIKDSSLASIIGVTELSRASLTVRSNTLSNWDVFAVLAGTYFVVCSVISYLGARLERRLKIVERTSGEAIGVAELTDADKILLRNLDNI
jgi:polar amino acid transport system permease protein